MWSAPGPFSLEAISNETLTKAAKLTRFAIRSKSSVVAFGLRDYREGPSPVLMR